MFERLRDILARSSGVPAERITRETRVGDLIDSLDLVELTVAIEEGAVSGEDVEFVSAARHQEADPFSFLDMSVGELAQLWEEYREGKGR